MSLLTRYAKCLAVAAAALGFSAASTARAATITIDSLDGDITANEITSFVNFVSAQTITTNDYGNYMADGTGGTTVDGCRRMYEATHDIRTLNLMLKYTDIFLAYRNDQPRGEHRVMWDGVVEPVWPPNTTTSTYPGYAGVEQGDVCGHIARAAQIILDNPSLWNQTVPDGNPYGFGATYKQRAQTYVTMLDHTVSVYFTKWFVNSSTDALQEPNDPRWTTNAGGSVVDPWNRQMMFLNAYQTLAECHDMLGDNPSFLSLYKNICNVSVTAFFQHVSTYTASGHTVYTWAYNPERNPITQPEDTGHGQYDIFGLFQAWNTNYTSISAAEMQSLADTVQYVMYLGPGVFASTVNNSNPSSTSNYLYQFYMPLAQFDPPLYKEIAQAAINAGGRQSGSAVMSAYILWMKHWIYINNFAGHYVLVSRNSAKAAVVQGASLTEGASIIQYTNNGSTNSKWTLTSVGGDYYKILNVNSGMALVVQGADTANGAACVQWPYGGAATNDEWKLQDVGGGYVKFINRNSRIVMDVAGASTSNGAVIDQWQWTGQTSQQWQVISVP